jgi:hypothetical protein
MEANTGKGMKRREAIKKVVGIPLALAAAGAVSVAEAKSLDGIIPAWEKDVLMEDTGQEWTTKAWGYVHGERHHIAVMSDGTVYYDGIRQECWMYAARKGMPSQDTLLRMLESGRTLAKIDREGATFDQLQL